MNRSKKQIFKKLGLAGLLDHDEHAFYYGNQSVWGNERIEEKLSLFEKHGKGILLNRVLFEEQLRDLSVKNGSDWFSGYSLHSAERNKNVLNVVLRSKTAIFKVSCDYIIDATGRKSSVCRKFGVEKETLDELSVLDFKYDLHKKIPLYVHTESIDKGWFYVAPCGDNKVSVMLFTDPEEMPEKNGQEKFIFESIAKTTLIKQLLGNVVMENMLDLKTRSANSVALRQPYGDNWLAVGDAAYSHDPVSSFGITSALAGGYYGAHALADIISCKADALQVYHYLMEKAFRDYRTRLHNHYSVEKRWTENLFWKKRQELTA